MTARFGPVDPDRPRAESSKPRVSGMVFTPSEMSPTRRLDPMAPAAQAALARMAMDAGRQIQEERNRRGWTLRTLADRAGVALGVAHDAEAGRVLSLQSYARLAAALGLRPTLDMADPRARRGLHAGPRTAGETADIVHATMGEVEARALAHPVRTLAIDEPYQHYQFAGRADVLAWDRENLLHIENRTRFPNLQEAAGSYNAKRRYLARDLAQTPGSGTQRLAERDPRDGLPLVLRGAPRDPAPACVLRGPLPGRAGCARGLAAGRATASWRDELPGAARPARAVRVTPPDDRRLPGAAAPRPALPRLRRRRGGGAPRGRRRPRSGRPEHEQPARA